MTRPNKLECLCLAITFQSSLTFAGNTRGMYYKRMMIVNDDSRVVNKLEASLTDDVRVIIYDHHMFIVQATGASKKEASERSSNWVGSGLALKF